MKQLWHGHRSSQLSEKLSSSCCTVWKNTLRHFGSIKSISVASVKPQRNSYILQDFYMTKTAPCLKWITLSKRITFELVSQKTGGLRCFMNQFPHSTIFLHYPEAPAVLTALLPVKTNCISTLLKELCSLSACLKTSEDSPWHVEGPQEQFSFRGRLITVPLHHMSSRLPQGLNRQHRGENSFCQCCELWPLMCWAYTLSPHI